MIEIKNLVKIYNKGKTNEFCALKGIDLSIEEGEMVAIIGKSGAGKSTLLHILAAIDSYDKGSYLVDGVSVGDLKEKERARFRNQKMGIVMQDYALIDEYTIEENVQIPLRDRRHGTVASRLRNRSAHHLRERTRERTFLGDLGLERGIARHQRPAEAAGAHGRREGFHGVHGQRAGGHRAGVPRRGEHARHRGRRALCGAA